MGEALGTTGVAVGVLGGGESPLGWVGEGVVGVSVGGFWPDGGDVGTAGGSTPAEPEGSAGSVPDERPQASPTGGFASFVEPFCTAVPGLG